MIANKCKIGEELFEKNVKRHLVQKHAELFHQALLESGKPLFNTWEKIYNICKCK